MKFSHSFAEELQSSNYPSEWRDAAIRYRQLKKCIKKVQKELVELGLNTDMLKSLAEQKDAVCAIQTPRLGYTPPTTSSSCMPADSSHLVYASVSLQQHSNDSDSIASSDRDTGDFDNQGLQNGDPQCAPNDVAGWEEESCGKLVTFSYCFDGTLQSFIPKLILTVDSSLPVNVKLAAETTRALEGLVSRYQQCLVTSIPASLRMRDVERCPSEDYASSITSNASTGIDIGHTNKGGKGDDDLSEVQASFEGGIRRDRYDHSPNRVLVPLSSDLEFFRALTNEITSIDVIESREVANITSHIIELADKITRISKPSSFSPSSDLYAWREIFQIYMESGIFFSPYERDGHKQHTVEGIERQINWFEKELERKGVVCSFNNRKSEGLLKEFLGINMDILRLLRFMEINRTAMRKILKKFDKRTALTASNSFPTLIASDPFVNTELAKSLCYTINEQLLSITPQLDDYLCPVCCSISIKPVRLNCSHVFCVRCLVKLQRERKHFCPICRRDVVLQADASNLDVSLLNFLRHYFPKESRIKQAENEQEVTQEQFNSLQSQGLMASHGHICAVM